MSIPFKPTQNGWIPPKMMTSPDVQVTEEFQRVCGATVKEIICV
jgi:hypothetical protein